MMVTDALTSLFGEEGLKKKGSAELAKLAKVATQGATLGNAIKTANDIIRETADTVKDAVDTVSSYVKYVTLRGLTWGLVRCNGRISERQYE